MIDAKHCSGCTNDFYNGHNDLGVKQCWSLPNAELVPRLLIHINQSPPYKGMKTEQVPQCYKRPHFVTVKTESLTAEGFWR